MDVSKTCTDRVLDQLTAGSPQPPLRLIEEALPRIRRLAGRLGRCQPPQTRLAGDLAQAGTLGLLDAQPAISPGWAYRFPLMAISASGAR